MFICRGIQLGNFSYVGEPLGLGASGGNQFDLVLRGVAGADAAQVVAIALHRWQRRGYVNCKCWGMVVPDKDKCTFSNQAVPDSAYTGMQVSAAVEGLAKDGFVNYFGLQRFGSGASATHRWVALTGRLNPHLANLTQEGKPSREAGLICHLSCRSVVWR